MSMAGVRKNGQFYHLSSSCNLKLGWILLVAFVGLTLTAYCYKFSYSIAQAQPLPQPLPQQKDYTIKKFFSDDMMSIEPNTASYSKPHCNITSQFNSWKKGAVTQIGLPIKYSCRKLFFGLKSELMSVQAQVDKWRSQHPWENFAKKFNGSCKLFENS